MIEHEAIQPLRKSIKQPKRSDVECPSCGGRMSYGAKQCRDCQAPRFDVQQPDDPSYRVMPLTRGYVTLLDTADYEAHNQWRWCVRLNKRDGKPYAVRTIWVNKRRVQIQLHRVIMGVTDPKIEVDHVRQDASLDNRRANIRIAEHWQNQANKRSFRNLSGYKGVSRVKKRPTRQLFDGWRAELTHGKKYASKVFRDPKDAAVAYDLLAVRHFGKFAHLNFPEDRLAYEEEVHSS